MLDFLTIRLHAILALRLAIRSRGFRALLVLGAALLAIAFLSGAFSLRQPIVVTTDIGLSGIRLLATLLVLLWIQEAFVRDIDRNTILWVFAFPAPRTSYVLGRFLGVMAIVGAGILLWGGALMVLASVADWGYAASSRPVFGGGFLLVLAGIFLDTLVVGSVVLWVGSVAQTPVVPFFVGGLFAIAARTLGGMIDYLAYSPNAEPALRQAILPVLQFIRWWIPDLGLLDWRSIVLYDAWPSAEVIWRGTVVAGGYALLFVGFSLCAYSRREVVQ